MSSQINDFRRGKYMCCTRWIALVVLLASATAVQAAMEAAELKELLSRLHEQKLWGEAVLADGRLRPIQVEALTEDSVAVREVVGALQERKATYALADIESLRELGELRIPQRRALYGQRKSMTMALVLETLVPGAGYLYVGETRQGLALLGLAGAAAGTAVATGKDGAAGWVPISAWIKVASLFNLGDQVRAINASSGRTELGLGFLPGGPAAVQVRVVF
jgi:hypothetical protein